MKQTSGGSRGWWSWNGRCLNACHCGARCEKRAGHDGDCRYGRQHQAVLDQNRELIEKQRGAS